MGKFKDYIAKEGKLQRPLLEIEKALYAAGFRYWKDGYRWARKFQAADGIQTVEATFDSLKGELSVEKYGPCPISAKSAEYALQEGWLEADDAEAFMDWADGILEKWL